MAELPEGGHWITYRGHHVWVDAQGKFNFLGPSKKGGPAGKPHPIPGRKSVSIDRFEGKSKQIAVLIDEEGETYLRPRGHLPEGAKEGDVLRHDLTHDREATERVHRETKGVQRQLRGRDQGGDIKLNEEYKKQTRRPRGN